MINSISEGALRGASKIDPSVTVHEKESNQQKAEELREARTVKNSEAGEKTDGKKSENDQASSKYVPTKKGMVFVKYDENGKKVMQLPPSETPVDEVV